MPLSYSFWLSLLTVHNNAEILRLKCGAHANFTTVKSSARLSNAFLTLEGLEATQCQFECTLNEKCKSINVNEDELICELNDKSFEDDKDNATLTSISSWTYYSTSYNETKVSFSLEVLKVLSTASDNARVEFFLPKNGKTASVCAFLLIT